MIIMVTFQQSRFLALVSNGERLAELSEEAANAEDTATLQVLKTMDSISAKSQQLQTSLQSMFTETGLENMYKGILDFGNQIIQTFTNMPTIFKMPIPAIMSFAQIFISLGSSISMAWKMLQQKLQSEADLTNSKIAEQQQIAKNERSALADSEAQHRINSFERVAQAAEQMENRITNAQQAGAAARTGGVVGNTPVPLTYVSKPEDIDFSKLDYTKITGNTMIPGSEFSSLARQKYQTEMFEILKKDPKLAAQFGLSFQPLKEGAEDASKQVLTLKEQIQGMSQGSIMGLRMVGSMFSMMAMGMSEATESARLLKAGIQGIGGAMQAISYFASGNIIMAVFTGAMTLFNALSTIIETTEERMKRLNEEAKKANNEYLQKKADYKNLDNEIEKLEELKKARFDSAEANEKYLEASNSLAEKTPELISYIDSEGNAVLDLSNSYKVLADARLAAAESAVEAGRANIAKAEENRKQAEQNYQQGLDEFVNVAFSGQGDFQQFLPDSNRLTKDFIASERYQTSIYNPEYTPQQALEDFVNYDQLGKGIQYSEEEYLKAQSYITNGENNLTDASKKLVNQAEAFKNLSDTLKEGDENNTLTEYQKALKEIADAYVDFNNSEEPDEKRENAKKLFEVINDNKEILDEITAEEYKENFGIDKEHIQTLMKAAQKAMSGKSEAAQAEALKELEQLNSLRDQIYLSSRAILESVPKTELELNKQDMLKNMPNANDIVTRYLKQQFNSITDETEKTDFAIGQGEYAAEYNKITNALTKFYTGLSIEAGQAFNSLIENKGKYTKDQLVAKIKEDTGKDLSDAKFAPIMQAIADFYTGAMNQETAAQAISERVRQIDYGEGAFKELLEGTTDILGADEWQKVLNTYDSLAKQQEQGTITSDKTIEALNAYAEIWQKINDTDIIPEDQIDTVSKIFEDWNDYSIPGLDSLRNSLEAAEIDPKVIESLMQFATSFANLIPENLIMDFETLSKNMVSQTEDFEKALKSASDGMDLEEATKMADKLDLSIKDFDFKVGKYFLKDADAIKDAYYKYNEDTLTELNNQYQKELQELNQEYQRSSTSDERKTEIFKEIKQLNAAKDDLDAAIEQYGEYQVNSFLISTGQIEAFLHSVLGENADISSDLEKITVGDFKGLSTQVQPYIAELYKLVNGLQKNVFDNALNSIKGEGPQIIDTTNGTDAQRKLIEELGGTSDDSIHYILDLTTKDIINTRNKILEAIKNGVLTQKQGDSYLAELNSAEYEHNVYDAFKGLVDTYDNFSYEAGQALLRAFGSNKSVEEAFGEADVEGNFALTYDEINKMLDSQIEELGTKKYNDLRAKLEAHEQKLSDTAILSTIIQNRDKLSEENVAALATMLNTTYNKVLDMLHPNADGTYSVSLATLQTKIATGQVEVSDAIMDLFATEIDEIVSSITGLAGSQSKGFTDLGSMQKYITTLREKGVEISGEQASLQNVFEYNDTLRAYQLSEAGIIAHMQAMKSELDVLAGQQEIAKLTGNEDKVREIGEQLEVGYQFINDSLKQFADNIDISAYLNTEFGSVDSNRAIENIAKAMHDYNAAVEALGDNAFLNVNTIVNALRLGGEDAVVAAQAIAELQGKTLSASDIESLYRRGISGLVNAVDKVTAQPGEIIDSVTASIIGFDNVEQLGTTGQYVVQSAANLYEAYNNLLQRMAAIGEATLADLNKVAALKLENRRVDKSKASEQYIIDALGDAANMTYTRFGELLTSAGYELSEELVNSWDKTGIIKDFGGSKMAITDFTRFADLMGWEAGSEQYVSAFKTYNDSMIQMNRQVERNILEEAQNVASAQGGDWINLTQLSNELNKQIVSIFQAGESGSVKISALDKLNEELQQFGAYIEDGILKIGETADIPAIMQAVAQAAAESGGLLSNEMAQLADTVADAIKSYADLISGGIEGSLTNTQAEQLQDWANKNGVGQLDFTPTEKGLKVATAQAQKLVAALKDVDSIQGKLTFDKLIEAMSADKGGKFSNISKTTAEIAKLQREIAKNNQEIGQAVQNLGANGEVRVKQLQDQNAKLEEQLSLYREIQEAQSMDPSQYNFMDRDLPEQFQGPINYWNSVGKAFAAMNESGQTGKMAISDFYNIVNEMENLANISGTAFQLAGYQIGGEASQAAKLITDGLGKLTNIDGKGVQIDLSQLGVDFVSGADNAKQNFADGVNQLAESQVAMLDAAIKVLEIVVAMEELGKVDVEGNNNGVIDLSEIFGGLEFDSSKGFDENYSEAADALLQRAEKETELKEALESVKVNGKSMYEMLDAARGTVDEQTRKWGELGLSEQQYQAVINGFYQALQNGDYNLDSIQSSVWEILDQVMPDGTTIDVGDRTILISGGTHVQINWENENTKEAMKNFGETVKEQKEGVAKSIQKYTSGKGEQIDAIIALAVKGKIKITYKGKDKFEIEDEDGNPIDPTSPTGQEIIAKAALEDAGVKDGQVVPGGDAGEILVEGTMKVGKRTIKVTADGNGRVRYHSDALNRDFNSINELIDAEYKEYARQEKAAGFEVPPKEVWAYQEYGIRIDIKTSFIDENGNPIEDPSSDPVFRKSLSDLLTGSQQSISDFISKNIEGKNGKYKLTLPGWGTIEVEAPDEESAKAELEAKIKELYAPMADSVQQGIVAAFTSFGEDGQKNAVQQAITTAIQEAFKGYTVEEGQEPTIPEIDAKVGTVHITEVGDASMGGSGLIDKGISSLLGNKPFPIDEADAKVTKLNITEVGNAEYNAGENITPPKIPAMDGEVTMLRLTTAHAPVVQTAGMPEPKAIPTLTAPVSSLTVSAEEIDVSSAAETIIQKLQEALSSIEINPSITADDGGGEEPTGGKSPDNNDKKTTSSNQSGGLSALSGVIAAVGAAATKAAVQLGLMGVAALTIKADNVTAIKTAEEEIKADEVTAIKTAEEEIGTNEVTAIKTAEEGIGTDEVTAIKTAEEKIGTAEVIAIKTAEEDISNQKVLDIKTAADSIDAKKVEDVAKAINNIEAPSSLKTTFSISVSKAKGNMGGVANAKGTGPAKVGGSTKTLMGELGPELVVSNGRYFLVGTNGAEFVDLADDAIVFNHLQTRRLMSQGAIGSRGKPSTNERNAVAFAKGKIPNFGNAKAPAQGTDGTAPAAPKPTKKIIKGKINPTHWNIDWNKGVTSTGGAWGWSNLAEINVPAATAAKGTGPAMSSASEALAVLKQLRAMWASLANASLADMGGNAGRGGGGGGGGGGNDKTEKAVAGIAGNVERWYNWLKLIETTQNNINKLTKEYTALEKQGASSSEKLANLQEQYELRLQNQQTRERLINEQIAYRTGLIEEANKGLMAAFYQADPETGQVYLAGDDAFLKYVNENQDVSDEVKKILKGQKKGNKITGINNMYTDAQKELLGQSYYNSHKNKKTLSDDEWKSLSDSEKKYYKKSGENYTLKSAKEIGSQMVSGQSSVRIWREGGIKTGLDFMDELFGQKDEAGNNRHDAKEQLALIKAMGFYTDDLLAGVDTEQEGWEKQVVENFKNKVESDKTEIEALNKSIEEQRQAALDDAAAMNEINEKIRKINTHSTKFTKELEKWYNYTQKIKGLLAEIDNLEKDIEIKKVDQKVNGKEIYENLQKEKEALNESIKSNENQLTDLEKERKKLVGREKDGEFKGGRYSDLINRGFIAIDERTKRAIFSTKTYGERKNTNNYNAKTGKGNIISATYSENKTITRNGKEYQIDTNGLYRDEEGVLRNAQGKKIEENAREEYKGSVKDKNGNYLTREVKYDENGNFGIKGKDGKWTYYTSDGNVTTDKEIIKNVKKAKTTNVEYDEKGRFIDQGGNLRNLKTGQIVAAANGFGLQASEEYTQRFKLNGRTLPEILEELNNGTDENGNKYTAETKYEVLKALGLEDYMLYNENGEKIYDGVGEIPAEKFEDAVNNAVNAIQNGADKINENLDKTADLTKENLDSQRRIAEIDKGVIDNQIAVENMVKEAVVQMHQDAIDQKTEFKDALNDFSSNVVDDMRKALDDEKSMYDEAQDKKQLDTLYKQLATAQKTNASLSTLQSLEDQIADEQQKMYFDEREELIDELEEASNKQIEALEVQIDIMQKTLDNSIETGLIWKEVQRIIDSGYPQVMDFLMKYDTSYKTASAQGKKQYEISVGDQVEENETNEEAEAKKKASDLATKLGELNDNNWQTNLGPLSAEVEAAGSRVQKILATDYSDKWEKYQGYVQRDQDDKAEAERIAREYLSLDQLNDENYEQNIDAARKAVTGSNSNVQRILQEQYKTEWDNYDHYLNEYLKSHSEELNPADLWRTNKSNPYQEGGQGFKEFYEGALNWASTNKDNLKKEPIIQYLEGEYSTKSVKDVVANLLKERYLSLLEQGKTPEYIARQWQNSDEKIRQVLRSQISKKGLAVPFLKYAQGGDIDYTGPAWVDGTKNEPEHIFNFQQMEALRAHLLNGVDVTRQAVAGLANTINNIPNLNTYNSINNDNDSGVNISKVEFHMEVGEIANDYDARQAGQTALNELVRVARKSGSRDLSRR